MKKSNNNKIKQTNKQKCPVKIRAHFKGGSSEDFLRGLFNAPYAILYVLISFIKAYVVSTFELPPLVSQMSTQNMYK